MPFYGTGGGMGSFRLGAGEPFFGGGGTAGACPGGVAGACVGAAGAVDAGGAAFSARFLLACCVRSLRSGAFRNCVSAQPFTVLNT